MNKHKQPALCLDLDGTVRDSKKGDTFIKSKEDIMLKPFVKEVVWWYRNKGYLIFAISNQGGVAFGYKTIEQCNDELEATLELFGNPHPFHICKMCYHHPEGNKEPHCHKSLFRKPSIGMLVECETDCYSNKIIVDWKESIFVGDREEDKQCAKNAGVKFIWANKFFSQGILPKEIYN